MGITNTGHLDRVLIWQRQDGGISISNLHENDMLLNETEDDFITRYTNRLKPAFGNVEPTIVDKVDIPKDRTNRNEWSLKNGKVEVDPVKVQAKKAKEAVEQSVTEKIASAAALTAEEKEVYEKIRGKNK